MAVLIPASDCQNPSIGSESSPRFQQIGKPLLGMNTSEIKEHFAFSQIRGDGAGIAGECLRIGQIDAIGNKANRILETERSNGVHLGLAERSNTGGRF